MTIVGAYHFRMASRTDTETLFETVIEEFEDYGWVYDYWIESLIATQQFDLPRIRKLLEDLIFEIRLFQAETFDFDKLVKRIHSYCDQFDFPDLKNKLQVNLREEMCE